MRTHDPSYPGEIRLENTRKGHFAQALAPFPEARLK
jgi:hypothetical protein